MTYCFDPLRGLGDQTMQELLEDVPTMNVEGEVEMAACLTRPLKIQTLPKEPSWPRP